MKKILLLALVALPAAWWQFVGWRQDIAENDVRAFYAQSDHALGMRDAAAQCALLDKKFSGDGYVSMEGQRQRVSTNKGEACEGYRKMLALWEDLGEQLDGIVQLDWDSTIHSITIAPDGKTATVDISSKLDVAGTLMNFSTRSTDTLLRKSGKVLMVRSEGDSTVKTRLVELGLGAKTPADEARGERIKALVCNNVPGLSCAR